MAITSIDLCAPARVAAAKLLVDGVGKEFATGARRLRALDRTDIAVLDNDFVCLVGPSGCGKSTLLNILAGFEQPTEGRVMLDGRRIEGPGAERGVVFQQGSLFTWMTVRGNVAFGPQNRGLSGAETRAVVDHHLALVGLSAFAERYPYELSGGMQQRVGIARALANDPALLLMDEPFAALDQQNRELLQEELKRIWQRTGKTVLLITHSIEEALFLGTHVLVMSARPGRIKAAFRSEFSGAPDHEVTASDAFARAKREVFGLLREESVRATQAELA